MNRPIDSIYQFVFKGLLTEASLDRAGRKAPNINGYFDADVAQALSIELLDDDLVAEAKQMAAVYTAVAAFENSARELVRNTLIGDFEDNWWSSGVSENIRKKAESRREEESKNRWHTPRGDNPMNYAELGDLVNIFRQNEETFEPFVPSVEWVKSIFDVIERSRNVIMHSGKLLKPDIERLGINIRDWVKQVGA